MVAQRRHKDFYLHIDSKVTFTAWVVDFVRQCPGYSSPVALRCRGRWPLPEPAAQTRERFVA